MRNLLALLLITLSFTSQAQIQVNRLDDDRIRALKGTTTLFVLQDKDSANVEEWDNAIKSVWTITPYKIIKYREMKQYRGTKYSFFSFNGFVKQQKSSLHAGMNSSTNVHLYYGLWMPELTRKGDLFESYYTSFYIYPDNETMSDADRGSFSLSSSVSLTSKTITNMHSKALIYNWSPYMLKGYLKAINDFLPAQEARKSYEAAEDEQGLKAMKNDTLYIPDYVNLKFSALSGGERTEETDYGSIQEYYPYPVKVVSTEQLGQIIAERKEPVYYLVFVKSSSDKYINVFEAHSGKMLYARYSALSYNFKYKDLKELTKIIR